MINAKLVHLNTEQIARLRDPETWYEASVEVAPEVRRAYRDQVSIPRLTGKSAPGLLASIPKGEIDKKDEYGLTMLMKAVLANDDQVVRRLVLLGADTEVTTDFKLADDSVFDGVTALGIAGIVNNDNMVKLLAALGADLQGGDSKPSMVAFGTGEENDQGTTSLIMDLVKARKLQSEFSKAS